MDIGSDVSEFYGYVGRESAYTFARKRDRDPATVTDPPNLAKELYFTSLHLKVKPKSKAGTFSDLMAIIDTGANFSMVPKKLFNEGAIAFNPQGRVVFRGISPDVPTSLGKIVQPLMRIFSSPAVSRGKEQLVLFGEFWIKIVDYVDKVETLPIALQGYLVDEGWLGFDNKIVLGNFGFVDTFPLSVYVEDTPTEQNKKIKCRIRIRNSLIPVLTGRRRYGKPK